LFRYLEFLKYTAIAFLAQLIWQNTAGNFITSAMFAGTRPEKMAMSFHPIGDYLLVPFLTAFACLLLAGKKKNSYWFAVGVSLGISLLLKLILFIFVSFFPAIFIALAVFPQIFMTFDLIDSGSSRPKTWPEKNPVVFFFLWTVAVCLPVIWEPTIGSFFTERMFGSYRLGKLAKIAMWLQPKGYYMFGILSAFICLITTDKSRFSPKIFLAAALWAIGIPLAMKMLLFLFINPVWAIPSLVLIFLVIFSALDWAGYDTITENMGPYVIVIMLILLISIGIAAIW
jgi:hypothetical protein